MLTSMFWLFSLVSHALIVTQLPIIFSILLITLLTVSFFSLTTAHYLVTRQWLLWRLFKACILATILIFMMISLVIYGLQQAELQHIQLTYKPFLALTIFCLPLVIWLISLKYYLQHHWGKIVLILFISIIINLVMIILIGQASKWATDHGYYASQLLL